MSVTSVRSLTPSGLSTSRSISVSVTGHKAPRLCHGSSCSSGPPSARTFSFFVMCRFKQIVIAVLLSGYSSHTCAVQYFSSAGDAVYLRCVQPLAVSKRTRTHGALNCRCWSQNNKTAPDVVTRHNCGCQSPVQTTSFSAGVDGRSLGAGLRPPGADSSCGYTERAAADCRQGVAFHLGKGGGSGGSAENVIGRTDRSGTSRGV